MRACPDSLVERPRSGFDCWESVIVRQTFQLGHNIKTKPVKPEKTAKPDKTTKPEKTEKTVKSLKQAKPIKPAIYFYIFIYIHI